MLVLALNSGSSSLKCAAIDPETAEMPFSALAQSLGVPQADLRVRGPNGVQQQSLSGGAHQEALDAILGALRSSPALWSRLSGVGHRVVHGGERFTSSCVIDDGVIAEIRDCARLAPLHNPANLLGIAAARRALPELPHVAVFDTAFHQTMPERAWRYAVPDEWYVNHGVRRYGFHGTSHRYVVARAAQVLGRPVQELNLITAHLGNGCSAAAVAAGRCVDTTMGMTPLEGLVMGTRSGDLDPAIIQTLHAEAGLEIDDIFSILNKSSGLLGLSGRSNDMRELLAAEDEDRRAATAIDVFCHRLVKAIGALATNFSRLDALVFTGGIGEHAAPVRARVVERLQILGLTLEPEANQRHAPRIDAGGPAVLVVPTNEELMIAQDTLALTRSV